jgi:hypothetical protein
LVDRQHEPYALGVKQWCRRMIASIVARVILFLLLGAIVNVAVAIGLAFAVSPWQIRVESSEWGGAMVTPNLEWTVERRGVAGSMQICSTWRTVDPKTFAKHTEWGFDQPGQSMFPIGLRNASPPSPDRYQIFDMRGLPCLSLWTERETQPWQGVEVPFRPLWPGFAINTVFYAVILWLLFAAPIALRRRRRIKRGLCPACAYPIGESDVCTECGRPLLK